jgi:hypothetical protein
MPTVFSLGLLVQVPIPVGGGAVGDDQQRIIACILRMTLDEVILPFGDLVRSNGGVG